ncbi:hypothetical protein L5M36_11170 [Shewanella sp. SM72]|uniref:SH3 domain-containing protein n=1 Tax=unclassified Shewanella TaxID=196818 RepID=UPI0021D8FFF7|nr:MULTISPECIES: SH3 domain-containing protein [unclassified Shewanella]MCU8017446.1 hypothetical protein [Shewanella sp. SM72]MCU8074999.1 hypothetical protein [Shewanella sp. SM29]
MTTKKYIVVNAHESEFPNPITFKKGDPLTVGDKYAGPEGWDLWFLCTTPGQDAGWVPGQVIQRLKNSNGLALEDYTARELNVHEGEQLIGTRMLNGWVWCIKAVSEESGWVPLENLKEVVDLSRD